MIAKLFEEQVKKNPGQIAVKTPDGELTYSQLNEGANRAAHAIHACLKEDETVGLLFEHGFGMIVSTLGAVKAGRTYIPLDSSYPEERLIYIVEDAGVRLIVTNNENLSKAENLADQLGENRKVAVVNLDTLSGDCSHENLDMPVSGEQIAYILYTSGSTGKPKGVLQSYQNIWYFVRNYALEFHLVPTDRLTLFSAFSHDAAVMDIFGGLLHGATLYPLKIRDQLSITNLASWLNREQITIYHSVPTVFRYFVRTLTGGEEFPRLRYIVLGGESVLEHDVLMFQKMFGNQTVLANLYGQSESSYNSTRFFDWNTPFGKVTLGNVIEGTEILVLDEEGDEVSAYGTGEIVIASEHVSPGYWQDPEKTEKVFGENPLGPGRLYWTGDLGRVLLDGSIEFMGRKDFQVKIRGYRVELGEIENRLLNHPAIREAVIVVKDDSAGNTALCAFYAHSHPVSAEELRQYLHSFLPDYMVPAYFVNLPALPLTPNHKLDRKALIEMETEEPQGTEYLAPSTEIEERLANLWSEILGVSRVGVLDQFFHLGGHSLKAAALVGRVQKEFGVELPLKQVFQQPVLREMAKWISGSGACVYTEIPVAEEREYYPVSFAQKRLFILHQLEEQGTHYNLPGIWELTGDFHPEQAVYALQLLADRHASLRTSFQLLEGEVVQQIHAHADLPVICQEAEEHAVPEILRDWIRPFDLAKAPLFRVMLLKIMNHRHIFAVDLHHSIADGISKDLLLREFVMLYEGRELPPLPVQYKDYAVWQHNLFWSKGFGAQEEYWLGVFAERETGREIPLLQLPTDFPRPKTQRFTGDQITFRLDSELCRRLRILADEAGGTLFMVLLSVYNLLLYRYTGQNDLVVGTPVAGRSHPSLERLIGMFVNTLALRNEPDGQQSFRELLSDVKERSLKAFANADYPFELLVEKLKPVRDLGHNPLFDTMFRLQNFLGTEIRFTDLQCRPVQFSNPVSLFDLQLTCIEEGESLVCSLEYNTGLFTANRIRRMAEHWQNILQAVVNDPDQHLAKVQMLSSTEQQRILRGNNQTKRVYASEKTIHRLFEEQAERTPDAVAVECNGQHFTYRELNRRANRLAYILREQGVGRETIVGLMVRRSFAMLIGIFGILKAGGAYLPLDPEYPAERLQFMLADSEARVLLLDGHTRNLLDHPGQNPLHLDLDNHVVSSGSPSDELQSGFAGVRICLDDERLWIDSDSTSNPVHCNQSGDLIYLIYTSGSTGQPKGTLIEHRSVHNFIRGIAEHVAFPAGKKVLSLTTICFDIFVLETLLPLCLGGTVILATEAEQQDPGLICKLICEEQADLIQLTPSRLQLLLETAGNAAALQRIQTVIVGGESFPVGTLARLQALTGARIFNMYGPTETTVWSTLAELTDKREVTIGQPMANTQIYILSSQQKLLPEGVIGEIYIAGVGVSRGYFHQPELTAERFMEDPFVAGNKMYRTGDLARWRWDGQIEFCGRVDYQMKIRGYRIEAGEIEAAVNSFTGIADSLVLVKGGAEEPAYLVCYYRAEEEIPVAAIRSHLAVRLPDYMIPGYYIHLTGWPQTPNGKIDRKMLPGPDGLRPCLTQEYQAPANAVEELISEIWQKTLQIELVGVQDNFFELGGNSLLLIQMYGRLDQAFPGRLTVADLFAYPTIARMAAFLTASIDAENSGKVSQEVQEYWRQELTGAAFLQLAETYFCTEQDQERGTVFQYSLSPFLTTALEKISGIEEVAVHHILTALYIHLFAEISASKDIVIGIAVQESLVPLRVQLAGIEDFDQLFRLVREKYAKAAERKFSFLEFDLSKIGRERDVFPSIVDCEADLGSQSDFTLKLARMTEQLTLVCTYNHRRLNKHGVEGIISNYIRLIELFVDHYNF